MRHRPTRAGLALAPRAEPASGLRGGGALDGGARIHVLHELGDIVVGGPLEDVAARARLHDAPAFEDGDLVAELQGLVEIVTDEEDGHDHDEALKLGDKVTILEGGRERKRTRLNSRHTATSYAG